jgi:hypothetical protein
VKFDQLVKVFWAIAGSLLIWRGLVYFEFAAWAVHWPYELNYGEGIVWQQALKILTPAAYGPISGFPAIVFHYTPLYHLTAIIAAKAFGTDLLVAGRVISVMSSALISLVISLIVFHCTHGSVKRTQTVIGSAAAGLVVFSMLPVIKWAHLMRVDMLAALLSLIGLWLGLRSYQRPVYIHVAVVFFVAAVYSKQTMVAAPTALFGVMLFSRPRLALTGIIECLVLGGSLLAALSWITDGGFLKHVFLYNTNRLEWRNLNVVFAIIIYHAPIVVAAAILTFSRLGAIRNAAVNSSLPEVLRNVSNSNYLTSLTYFLLCTAMLIMLAKSGADVNYTIEWLLALSVLTGIGIVESINAWQSNRKSASDFLAKFQIVPLLVPLLFVAQAFHIGNIDFPRDALIAQLPQLTSLSEKVKASDKPIISDEMVLLLKNGKEVVWESAIFAELASQGQWDERKMISMIQALHFGMFITVGKRGDPLFDRRYTPDIAAAIDGTYPLKEKAGPYTVHLPATQLAPRKP